MPSIPLADQVVRLLRRQLAPEEAKSLARAEQQGFNFAGRHHGNFTKDLPSELASEGERAMFHIDPTPTGVQAAHRAMVKNDPSMTTEILVAKLLNPTRMTDEGVNNMTPTIKNALAKKGSNSAVYSNTGETGKIGRSAINDFMIDNAISTSQFNPSVAISDPSAIRKWNAKFDPSMVGKPGWMAGVGAGSVMTRSPEPPPRLNEDLPLENVGITGPEALVELINILRGR